VIGTTNPHFPVNGPKSTGFAYQYLLQSGRRESTVSTYTTGLNNFIYFLTINVLLQDSTLEPGCMAIPDVSPSLFGHYLAWMYQCMYKFNTIKSYTTAIKMWCRANRRRKWVG
jgi:hypothetical protein